MKRLLDRMHAALAVFQLRTTGRWIAFGLLIGVLGGFASTLFNLMLGATDRTLMGGLAHVRHPRTPESRGEPPAGEGAPVPWLVVVLPAAGALFSAVLVLRYAPEAEGHGTDGVIAAFHHDRGRIRGRVPIVKLLASTAVIGAGGSAGREGPVVQATAGVASRIADVLSLSVRERRLLVLAGIAAGVGGMFRAPLGGALFAVEVLYRSHELESEGIVPAAFASIVSYTTTLSLGAPPRLFDLPPVSYASPLEMPAYLLLALVLSVFGVIWVRFFYGVRDIFHALPIPRVAKPVLGGLGLGTLALFVPGVMGGGYGYIQEAILGKYGLAMLVVLALSKILGTSLTVGSGASGGVFAPSVYIGAMLGGATAEALKHVLPASMAPQTGAFVIVGMGGFFAGIGKVPLTSLILVAEMTGDYNLFLPMLLVSSIAFLATGELTIYESQPASVARSPAHEWEFRRSILDGLKVSDTGELEPVETIAPRTRLREIVTRVLEGRQLYYPIVGPDGGFHGGFTLDDVRSLLLDASLGDVVIAEDIAHRKVPTLVLDEDLHSAIAKFSNTGLAELPVVSPTGGRFLGTVGRRQILRAYDRRLAALNEARGGPAV